MMCCQPCIVVNCPTDAAAFLQGPIAMTIKNDHKRSLLSRLAAWWRSRRSAVAFGDGEAAACDARVNEAKPRTLAGKWPRAANLLDQKLKQLNAFRDEPGRARAYSSLVEGQG
jgi:hypothetical protein